MSTVDRHRLITVCAVIALAAGCGVDPTQQPGAGDTTAPIVFADDAAPSNSGRAFVSNELLVQAFPGVDQQQLQELFDSANLELVESIPELDLVVLSTQDGEFEAATAALAASDLVEGLHKNYIFEAEETPNDPLFASQRHWTDLGLPEAWDLTTGAEEVIIAIVDTGIDSDHPDLTDKIIGGWNVYENTGNYEDDQGHGTAVAGLAAASTNNAEGIAGASWQSPILAVKAADSDGSSTARHLAAGILWSVANGAKVINVSFAPLHANSVVQSAVEQAYNRGAIVVISSGNSGQEFDAAGYPEALFAGALSSADRIASFSDRGPYVDIVAHGSGVRTTAIDGSYQLSSGTSFSAPIVAGVAALVFSANPDLRPTTVQSILLDTARDRGSRGEDDIYGHGMVQAQAAVDSAMSMVAEDDTTPPTIEITSPADGSRKSSRFKATARATDNESIADVVLLIDAVPFATDSRSPYAFSVDPSLFSGGGHTLAFAATDVSGNTTTSDYITLTFGASGGSSGTEITFTSPAEGSTVGSIATINASVSDPDGLSTIEWFVDGTSVLVNTLSGTSSIVTLQWRTAGVESGSHTITATVTDAQGRTQSSNLNLQVR